MGEQIDFGAAGNDAYFYRFDEINRLLRHRNSDKVLRAARRTGSEMPWSHHQVRDAHNRAPAGHAAYRICFWNSLSEALRWNGGHEGWILQRISKSHPFFRQFDHGEDEHLPGRATIFWAVFPQDPLRPEWSPVGIPHHDIEALSLDNWWRPMEQIGIFSESMPGWDERELGPCKVEVRVSDSKSGPEPIVLIRQRSSRGPLLMSMDWRIGGAMTALAESWSLDPSNYRWIVAFEGIENVLAREIEFLACGTYFPGIRGRLARARKRPDGYECEVTGSQQLAEEDLRRTYREFGLEELLRRGTAWNYRKMRRQFAAQDGVEVDD